MPQSAEHVLDHFDLFRGPEYQQMLANKKKMFENPRDPAEVERVREWAKTPEYREKNFAREALTVNPAKACQPLGAVFAAVGFEQTIPFVHGSQGCVAYYRSHLSRHFKEPSSCVSSSSSMIEPRSAITIFIARSRISSSRSLKLSVELMSLATL